MSGSGANIAADSLKNHFTVLSGNDDDDDDDDGVISAADRIRARNDLIGETYQTCAVVEEYGIGGQTSQMFASGWGAIGGDVRPNV